MLTEQNNNKKTLKWKTTPKNLKNGGSAALQKNVPPSIILEKTGWNDYQHGIVHQIMTW